ncbi:hypothetical protein O3P69_008949 [Scylla paramamosain]|uniref:Uncharacterized protein n=1 Tax=Scylla paramamosain TaxID=85552 RepID=A0AAW0TQF5_SCYPA
MPTLCCSPSLQARPPLHFMTASKASRVLANYQGRQTHAGQGWQAARAGLWGGVVRRSYFYLSHWWTGAAALVLQWRPEKRTSQPAHHTQVDNHSVVAAEKQNQHDPLRLRGFPTVPIIRY